MEKQCGNCGKFRKKPFTTVFECTKYKKCLEGRPPMKCKECLEADEKPSGKKSKNEKKDFIEVK